MDVAIVYISPAAASLEAVVAVWDQLANAISKDFVSRGVTDGSAEWETRVPVRLPRDGHQKGSDRHLRLPRDRKRVRKKIPGKS